MSINNESPSNLNGNDSILDRVETIGGNQMIDQNNQLSNKKNLFIDRTFLCNDTDTDKYYHLSELTIVKKSRYSWFSPIRTHFFNRSIKKN